MDTMILQKEENIIRWHIEKLISSVPKMVSYYIICVININYNNVHIVIYKGKPGVLY